MRYRSSNPVIRHYSNESSYASEYQATYAGIIAKTALLLAIMVAFALIAIERMTNSLEAGVPPFGFGMLIFAPIVALISVIVVMRSPKVAPFFAIIYAICQGSFLGIISGIYHIFYGDFIVETAMLATLGVFTAMLILYATGLVRVGNFFRKALFAALLGLLFSSLFLIITSLFVPIFASEMGMTLIFGITVIAVIVASLYLLVDFDNIQKLVTSGADKSYEWALSIGLIVTLVWLYVELLRLIAILRSRD